MAHVHAPDQTLVGKYPSIVEVLKGEGVRKVDLAWLMHKKNCTTVVTFKRPHSLDGCGGAFWNASVGMHDAFKLYMCLVTRGQTQLR